MVFNLNLNYITYFMRVMVFLGPVIAFIITRRWCISLQRSDEARLLHGYETGVIMRSPEGAYAEKHLPINAGRRLHPHRPATGTTSWRCSPRPTRTVSPPARSGCTGCA